MSARLSIYLDDCADSDLLAGHLREAGHTVVTPRSAGTGGIRDPDHLAYAASHGHALLTFNPEDFEALHDQWQERGERHSGILLVYFDNDVSRDMQHVDLVRALGNLIGSGVEIANGCHTLNHWRWA